MAYVTPCYFKHFIARIEKATSLYINMQVGFENVYMICLLIKQYGF